MSKRQQEEVACPHQECDKTFADETAMKRHYGNAHPEALEERLQCEFIVLDEMSDGAPTTTQMNEHCWLNASTIVSKYGSKDEALEYFGIDPDQDESDPDTWDLRGPNWEEQQRKVRERDDFRCQVCGADKDELGKNPHAHHIRARREFKRDAIEGDGEIDYDAMHALSNLVLLCGSCHGKYGNLCPGADHETFVRMAQMKQLLEAEGDVYVADADRLSSGDELEATVEASPSEPMIADGGETIEADEGPEDSQVSLSDY